MTQPSTPSNPFPVPTGPWQLPEQTGTTITMPLASCGCGVLLGEVCDCAAFAAGAYHAPEIWGWTP